MARILIIEDNVLNMKLTTLLVHRAGHSTLAAVDAESGVLLAQIEQPDVILMDVQLPGMDGFAATKLLKKDPATAHIPVVALTAMALIRDQDRARKAGCDAYLVKPLHHRELQDTIKWLMPRTGDEAASDSVTAASAVAEVTPGEETTPDPEAKSILSPDDRVGSSRAPGAARILVAEDNPTNQKLIMWQLNLLGFDADMTDNGVLALAQWSIGDYDLVITDLHMPEMTGYELATAIRAAEPSGTQVPILAMTASAVLGDEDQTLMVGMNEYLMRPLSLVKLRAALERWLPVASNSP